MAEADPRVFYYVLGQAGEILAIIDNDTQSAGSRAREDS